MQLSQDTKASNEVQKLKDEILARRKELEATLARAKADAKTAADDKVAAAKKRLDELKEISKNEWDQMSEATAKKLNDWLKRH